LIKIAANCGFLICISCRWNWPNVFVQPASN
jgi:hypothetical protein